jgi:hypothetical protein
MRDLQIHPSTGIAQDYFPEYNGKWQFYDALKEEVGDKKAEDELFRMLKKDPIQRYEIRFADEESTIDFENPRIPILNQIADYLYIRTIQDKLTKEMFLAMCGEVHEFVYGVYREFE